METPKVKIESVSSENAELDEPVNAFLEIKLETPSSPVFEASFIETSNKILKYKCPVCKKKFKNKEKVETHVNSHITVHSVYTNGDFKCMKCNCYLENKDGLQSHMKKHKKGRGRPRKGSVGDDGDKPFICDKCAKGFKRKQQLLNHCLVHFDLKPYMCDQCEKCFKLKQQLQNHMKVHYDIRPFKCVTCEKSFKFKQQLENHDKSHTDIRPFPCMFCDKAFKFKQQLQTHCRVHDDLRPFQCGFCDKAFKLKQQLQFHNRVHSDERPFECETCGKSFKLKQQLKTHMKVHAKSFVDSICEPILEIEMPDFMDDSNSDDGTNSEFMDKADSVTSAQGKTTDSLGPEACSNGDTESESVGNGDLKGNVGDAAHSELNPLGDESTDKTEGVTCSETVENGKRNLENPKKAIKKSTTKASS